MQGPSIQLSNSTSTETSQPATMNTIIDWNQLPEDIVGVIAMEVKRVDDFARFGAVCKSWNQVFFQKLKQRNRQLPFLVYESHKRKTYRLKKFYNMSTRGISSHCLMQLPSSICLGSTISWLVMFKKAEGVLQLVNPLSGNKNSLSVRSFSSTEIDDSDDLGYYYDDEEGDVQVKVDPDNISRIVLKDDPFFESDFILAGICGGGDTIGLYDAKTCNWSSLACCFEISNLIFYEGELYLADFKGNMCLLYDYPDDPKLSVAALSSAVCKCEMIYLAKSEGSLLQIRKVRKEDGSVEFQVLSANFDERSWDVIKSLRGQAIFVGKNESVVVASPDYEGFQENSIYFTDEAAEAEDECSLDFHEIGIYSLEDGSVLKHYPISVDMTVPAPIWIESRKL